MRFKFIFFAFLHSLTFIFSSIFCQIEKKDAKLEFSHLREQNEQIIALTETGKEYFYQKNYQKSLEFLMKAKNLNPEDLPFLAPYYRAFSDLFKTIGAFDASISCLKKVINTSDEKLLKYYSFSDIGALFLTINENDSALYYFQKQYTEAKNYMADYVAEASALNNQGLALMKMKRFSEANTIFQKASVIMEVNAKVNSKNFSGENLFKYAILENSGRCYYQFKNYYKTIELLEYSKQYLGKYHIDENNRVLMMAYLKTKSTNKAKGLLDQLSAKTELSLNQQKKLQEIKLDYYLELNLLKSIKPEFSTLNKIDEQLKIEDNVKNNLMSNLLTQFLVNEATLNAQREKIKKQLILQQLSVQKQQNSIYKTVTFLLVAFAMLGVYLSYLYLQNKKKTMQLQKDRLILQSQEQSHKLKVQETNLVDMAIGLNKNHEYEQNIVNSLQQITEAKPNEIQSEIKSLLAEIKQKQFIDQDTEKLFNEAKAFLEPFRLQLNLKHPSLSKSDIQLCYYVRLNLSNKEIAVLKNVATNSIKIFKNRLRKKLMLMEELTLVEYLNSF